MSEVDKAINMSNYTYQKALNIQRFLEWKANRSMLIKTSKDAVRRGRGERDLEEFTQDMLKNWNNLEESEWVQDDLKGLLPEEKEKKIEEVKWDFCVWLAEQQKGDDAVIEKKVSFENSVRQAKGGLAGKVKAGMKVVSGKIGRNDPCPCGSGKKYKKCCKDKEVQE
jgi:uncharacterized protein YecA (UPF0149 family)